jgi:hypothetical protein
VIASWREPIDAAEIHAGRTGFDEPALKDLFQTAASLDGGEKAELLNDMEEGIDELPGFQASWLAVIVGGLVEAGADAGPAFDAILDRLAGALPPAIGYFAQAERHGRPELRDAAIDELEPAIDPEGYRCVMAARFFAMAAMTALVRAPSLRIATRARHDLVAAVFEMDEVGSLREIYALSQVLQASDGETVVVVCPATRRGAEFKTKAVRNCAHLYTLLDLVIREKNVNLIGRRPSRRFGARLDEEEQRILDAARGSVEAYGAIGYDAPFAGELAFGTWSEIDSNGAFEPIPIVGVDAPVSAFPRLDGVIVLGAGDAGKHMKRSWGIAFFDPLHGDLKCDVEFQRVLPRKEVEAWMTRICDRGN